MEQTPNNLAAYIWSLADLLRGDFKQSQYGRIILPFTILRRLECVLEKSKESVLTAVQEMQTKEWPEEAKEKILLRATGGLSFFNASKMDLSKLGEANISVNLKSYIKSFSKDAREIFDHFKFDEFITQLNDANLLYKMVLGVRQTDLSPQTVSNHDMGLAFEELIRRFAENSNETAGEHFTPRDIVRLTTSLVLTEDDDTLTKAGIIREIYDPTAGTGGFLSSGMEYVHKLNPEAKMIAYGQELNPESYAICKADMLIKGQSINNIKLGNTLTEDQLFANKFDYMLSNPPFGVDWKKIELKVKDELEKGFNGRFGPGLPRVSDGSLLFLLHLISKIREASKGGARIGIILNGSPLFTGGAGSGESEIRRYILETDLLEAIIALPTDMFYNTGISTYIWILSNKKTTQQRGKVLLINGMHLYSKMRKSLGAKRNEMSEADIQTITRAFGNFEAIDSYKLDKIIDPKSNRGRQATQSKTETSKTFSSKIFNTYEFGYRRITIERPLRESYQFTNERVAEMRFSAGALNIAMKWIYDQYGSIWSDDENCTWYGSLAEHQEAIRKYIKIHFSELKEKQIKDLLDRKIWLEQKQIWLKAKKLQQVIGTDQYDDMNLFDEAIKAGCKKQGIGLEAKEKKQIKNAVSWKNPEAKKVIKKIHTGMANPLYGMFAVDDQILEYEADGDLRDYENIALNPFQSVNVTNEAYFLKEVQPHVPDAWINATKKDKQDQKIGTVGYEISFNRYFYQYQPPRDLLEIDRDLDTLSAEIMELLQEVHS